MSDSSPNPAPSSCGGDCSCSGGGVNRRTALKAVGATSRSLFAGVVLQAVVVTFVASSIGAVLAVALDLAVPPGGIPYTLLPARVISSVVFLLVAAIIGCAFSLRRVLKIDPASAIGGAT